MLRLKPIGIAVAIICSLYLVGLVNHSDAASVTSMSVYSGDDWGSGTTVSVSLTTDEDILFIDWYIDDEHSFTSLHGNTQSVYEYLGTFDGNIKGKKYDVRAVVSFVESSDAEGSDTFRVYKPIYLSRTGENTGAQGYAEISSFYYTGSHIIMSSYAYASNPTNNPEAKDPNNNTLRVAPWFWTQKYPAPDGAGGDERRDTKVPEDIEVGETSQYFYAGPHTNEGLPFDRDIGTLGKGQKVYYKAHTHLHVFTIQGNHKEDHWEVDTQQQTGTAAVTFTAADGP